MGETGGGRDRFAGRVVAVTGSGGGLGRVLGLAFAHEGAAVLVSDVDGMRAERVAGEIVAAGGRARATRTDVTSPSEVAAMFAGGVAEFGAVDVLVNNAARTEDVDFLEVQLETWEEEIRIVLRGAFLCSRAVLPAMIEQSRGAILNVGTVNAFAYFGNEAYSAAKAGLVSLTRSLAVRFGPDGVRVNMVAPGTLRSPAWDERLKREPEILERVARWYPLGRVGEPEDVVGAALFLCSDEASWVTGSVLGVDGGLLAGPAPMVSDIVGPPDR